MYAVVIACFISTLTKTDFSDVTDALLDDNSTGFELNNKVGADHSPYHPCRAARTTYHTLDGLIIQS